MSSNIPTSMATDSLLNQERTQLFVSDLPVPTSTSELEAFFGNYKEHILNIQISPINLSSRNSMTATILFKSPVYAGEALKKFNLRKLRGKSIRIGWYLKDNLMRYKNDGNLYIRNIPQDITPREVYEHFITFGEIMSLKMNEDENGNHFGYGYVNYESPEAADKAQKDSDGKEIWDSKLEVKPFVKQNERLSNSSLINTNLYVKNIPQNYLEKDVQDLFQKFGNLQWTKILEDQTGRKFAIVSFENENSAVNAKDSLDKKTVDNQELFVDWLQKKEERQKVITNQINEKNMQNYISNKNCNLHIRNIPYEATEEDLVTNFSKFGTVASTKITKMMLVTTENNVKVEKLTSKGFGYVLFDNPQSAQAAKDALNGKFLSGYEYWNRPLLIDFFIPKNQRLQNMSQMQNPTHQGFQKQFPVGMGMPFANPQMMSNMQMPYFGQLKGQNNPQMMNMMGNPMFNQMPMQGMPHPNYGNNMFPPQVNMNMPQNMQEQPNLKNLQQNMEKMQMNHDEGSDRIDMKYLDSLEDESSQKEYLGEIIFKKIEVHPFISGKNATIDTIGKITGMILGIEEIREIVDIATNYENLSERIEEAYHLLQGSEI